MRNRTHLWWGYPLSTLCVVLDIFPRSYSYLGDFEVPLVLPSFRHCYTSHTVDPSYNCPLENWLYWGDLSFLIYVSQAVLAQVILLVSCAGRGRTTQLLYELKLRAAIIGYTPSFVVCGSLKPLLGKTYLATFSSSFILPLTFLHFGLYSLWSVLLCALD